MEKASPPSASADPPILPADFDSNEAVTLTQTREAAAASETTETGRYLELIGVPRMAPLTSPFDPGYDPATLASHLEQSGHLISILKISMACWMIAREAATRAKLAAAREHEVRTVTGGGPFEVAVAQGRLAEYLDLCGRMGFERVECGAGFTDMSLAPADVVAMASDRGLEVQYEVGPKHGGGLRPGDVGPMIDEARAWLEAGAREIVVEARESAVGVGVFDADGRLGSDIADRFADVLGLDSLCFEAPTKSSQFSLLDHFGPGVRLSNVRLEELLRVEIYRRGLHSDAFANPRLRPPAPDAPRT
jgi:phosphosulfolactate synthase